MNHIFRRNMDVYVCSLHTNILKIHVIHTFIYVQIYETHICTNNIVHVVHIFTNYMPLIHT